MPEKAIGMNNVSCLSNEIRGWKFIRDIEIEGTKHLALNPETLVFREYRSPTDQPLILAIVYHQNDRWGAHDPIVCYLSQGWKVVEHPNIIKIGENGKALSLNRLIFSKDGVLEVVYFFWFSSSEKTTHSRNIQMLDMVLNGILYGFTESGFVRISMPIGVNKKTTISEINDFTLKFNEALLKRFSERRKN
jgi:EpsI family protein